MPARPPVMPLLLTDSDVRAVLPMADLIETMERALSQFASGEADQPVRTVMEVGASTSFFGVMPVHMTDPAALGTKLMGVFPGNITRGLATHQATIVLFDPESGVLRAVLDGRYVTEARTAAVSLPRAPFQARRAPCQINPLAAFPVPELTLPERLFPQSRPRLGPKSFRGPSPDQIQVRLPQAKGAKSLFSQSLFGLSYAHALPRVAQRTVG